MIDTVNWEGVIQGLDFFDEWKLSHDYGKHTFQIKIIPDSIDQGSFARAIRWVGRALRIERLSWFRWGYEYHGKARLKPCPGGFLLRGVGALEKRRIQFGREEKMDEAVKLEVATSELTPREGENPIIGEVAEDAAFAIEVEGEEG